MGELFYDTFHQDESLVLPTVDYYELYNGAVQEGRDLILVADDIPWVVRLDEIQDDWCPTDS